MAYQIELTASAVRELQAIRAFDRRRIVDGVKKQSAHEPLRATRHRKELDEASPAFEHVPPVWRLRVGDYRVFYDVDESDLRVYVRAVRRKDPHQTTQDIVR